MTSFSFYKTDLPNNINQVQLNYIFKDRKHLKVKERKYCPYLVISITLRWPWMDNLPRVLKGTSCGMPQTQFAWNTYVSNENQRLPGLGVGGSVHCTLSKLIWERVDCGQDLIPIVKLTPLYNYFCSQAAASARHTGWFDHVVLDGSWEALWAIFFFFKTSSFRACARTKDFLAARGLVWCLIHGRDLGQDLNICYKCWQY